VQVKTYLSKRLWLILSLLALTGLTVIPARAQQGPDTSTTILTFAESQFTTRDFPRSRVFLPRKIGLALSGGGARGIAQVGVLKAFDEAGLSVNCIAGTSMGSIIGGMYASGYSAAQIDSLIRATDFSSLFSDSPKRSSLFLTQRLARDRYLLSIRFDHFSPYIPRALTTGQRLTSLLTDLTIKANYQCRGDFDRLPIRYRSVAADIATGKRVAIASGSLADAMRASMAFPLAFTAVEHEGRQLMDGGIVDPIPVDVCRELGCDYVIAVNTVSPLMPVNQIDDPVDIANQVTSIMSQDELDKQLKDADLVLEPIGEDYESVDFSMIDSLVALGYKAGKKAIATLMDLQPEPNGSPHLTLTGIDVDGDSPYLRNLAKTFPIQPGEEFNEAILKDALRFADREKVFNRTQAVLLRHGSDARIVLSGTLNHRYNEVTFQINGNTVFPDSQVMSFFPIEDNTPVSIMTVKRCTDSLLNLFWHDGYDLALISSIAYDHTARTVTITIDEGWLEQINIRGNERTRGWIIKANIPLSPGEPFNRTKLEAGLNNVYGTDYFERVGTDIQAVDSGARLIINVKEKKFTQMRLGAHWHEEYKGEGFVELLDANVMGAGVELLGHGQFGTYRKKYYVSVKADRLFVTLVTAQTRLYFDRLERRLFYSDDAPFGYRIEDRLGWDITVGQQIARLGVIDMTYRIEGLDTKLTRTGATTDDILSTLTFQSTVETFNKYPYPDYGYRNDLNIVLSGTWLGGTFSDYTKVFGSSELYWKWGNYLNFHPRVSAGIATDPLPPTEKYFLGGQYRFAGLRTDQIFGDKFALINLQLRLKLPYRFYLIGSYDYGNVFNDYEDIKLNKFIHGWGASLSFASPLGPFDFGIGKARGRDVRIYVNLGLRF
jgi:NTE family protein